MTHPSKTNFLEIFNYKQVSNFKKLITEEKTLKQRIIPKEENL